MKATNDFIIVQNSLNEEKKSEGGVILSRADKNAENKGVVISVGDYVENNSIKVGDTVWFSSVTCRVGEESRKLVAIQEKNIIAIGE